MYEVTYTFDGGLTMTAPVEALDETDAIYVFEEFLMSEYGISPNVLDEKADVSVKVFA